MSPSSYAQEGAGLLRSDLNGAFPKALWRDQPRSEINYLLKNLPANAPLRSIQEIKRNMLLSTYDTSLIQSDIETPAGDDLLTLRLQKLMEMGLWEDAFTLYTKTTEDPKNNDKLAQVGVVLILLKKGIPTACLEEKVLSVRFPETPFWSLIDSVCNAEMGSETVISTQLSESAVLQAIYNDSDFKVSANSVEALNKLTPLELALLSIKGRIDYQQVSLAKNLPARIIKTYLEDPRFPSKNKESLEALARQQALLPESPLSDLLQEQAKDPQNLMQRQLKTLISHQLKLNKKISSKEVEILASLTTENNENFFYIQILNTINTTEKNTPVSAEDFNAGMTALSTRHPEKVNLLKSLLDKPAEFSNNLANVYEKHVSLTPDDHYVMSTESFANWLTETKRNHFAGLSLLIILSNIEEDTNAKDKTKNSGDTSEKTTVNMLNSLGTVGLIDQSYHIAKEELANLMGL